jgi:Domain of unknown function (DUF4232)
MRFHAVGNPRARPAACHGLTRAGARSRAVALGILAVAASGLVMTACGNQSAPGAASSSSTTPPPGSPSAAACVTSDLKISLAATGALAGQAGGYLKFTNDSGAPCRMSGWPTVIGLTAAGQATHLGHLQSSMYGAWHYTAPPPVITLQPGNSAYAIVAADNKPAGSSSRCPAPYTRLKVSPPGDSGSVTISAWLPGAVSYLPACTSVDGSPTAGTSTVTTLSSLPH